MFRGHSVRSIDPKGRLMLPPEFRDLVFRDSADGRLMLAKFDDCVNGYPVSRFAQIEADITAIKNPTQNIRNFTRFFLGSAQEVEMDRQGRILIPPSLREYAALDKEAVLVGVGFKFEIWDRARFAGIENQDYSGVFADIAASGVEVSI